MDSVNPGAAPAGPRKSPVKKALKILGWVFLAFMGLLVIGYFIPDIARFGFRGTVRVLDQRLAKAELTPAQKAELTGIVRGLSALIETSVVNNDVILRFRAVSDPLEKALGDLKVSENELAAVRSAVAAAGLSIPPAAPASGQPAAVTPAAKKK